MAGLFAVYQIMEGRSVAQYGELFFSMSELEYFLFVLVRVSAFIFVAPFFSTKGVPNNVK